ncbi:DUF6577 family protein [Aquirufa ecclesiirivi]|uniref:DUF6577 family protein n=1 Tax=Aquirufa ecclesiirivi TaxID=2715124 RepID=UPI0030B84712
MKQTTVNWRVYSLVQMGLINRIGRGKFIIEKKGNFIPDVSPKMKTIHHKLIKSFPYLKICIWNTSALNEFMLHQPGRFYLLIEVEKEATQSVFYFLKDAQYSVFIEPTSDLLEKYAPKEKESLIIRSLVSEAPLQSIKGINTTSLEKMLVDVFCDDVIFPSQQGAEMRTLFMEALNKYSVNENRMLRYASRRGKKESFSKYLNSISNLWQNIKLADNL